ELLTYLVHSEFRIYKYIKAKTLAFDYHLPGSTKLHFSKSDYLSTDSGYFKIKDEVLKTFSPKNKNHFNGKIYILSNGGSRSATSTMLALMRTYYVGTIVGQESGGVFNDVDGRKNISLTLPYSGIQLGFPAWSFKINSSGGDRLRGVIPDYIVETTKFGLDNKDSELELVYKLIGENQ
ncbi:MAG: S41 family peptidase, partial [Candidatus Paceibacterales bacterium]